MWLLQRLWLDLGPWNPVELSPKLHDLLGPYGLEALKGGKQKSQHTLAIENRRAAGPKLLIFPPLRAGFPSLCLASKLVGSLVKDGGGFYLFLNLPF